MTAVVAHRGASGDARENTIEAFVLAAQQGADAVELDLRITADGVAVVHHDAVLADGCAIALTPARDLPSWVPHLDEALDACAGMWVNIEIKSDPNEIGFDPSEPGARVLAEILARRGEPSSQWLVSSFRRATIDLMRALSPDIPTAWLCISAPPGALEGLVLDGHRAIHPYVECVSASLVQRCHTLGLMCTAWTCDDPVRMAELAAMGIDGICTNVPGVARQVVDGSRGMTKFTASGT